MKAVGRSPVSSGSFSAADQARLPRSAQSEEVRLPRRCTLDGFAEEIARTSGIHLAELPPITALLVRTQNTLYRITVLQPLESKVLVQGGRFFDEPTEARLNGASFGGSLLKTAWVGIGLRMEIGHNGRRIVTSPVRAIDVGEDSVLPGPF